jgi:diguanylate cyclase (GGDEF)-like protein
MRSRFDPLGGGERSVSHVTRNTSEYHLPEVAGEACLVVLHAPTRRLLGASVTLTGEAVIGRDPGCDLALDVIDVSRRHARIREELRCHVVEDLGSTNGTFVDGKRVSSQRLESGDLVRIGSVVLKYLAGDDLEVLYHAEMKRLADEDALTGLAHKVVFTEALAREIARSLRHGHPLCIALLDLDGFKNVNDRLGHLAGDEVLRDLAGSIRPLVRAEQLFARFGGDEMALLLPDVTPEGAAAFAEKIRRLVSEKPFGFEGSCVHLTISIGIASMRPEDRRPEDMLSRADAYLYEAKRSGGNRACG